MESVLPYIQEVGEIGGAGVLMVLITYLFLLRFSRRAFKEFGLEEVKMPFGIYLKRSNAEENADSDAVIVEGIYETCQRLEYKAREKMRAVMQQMAYDYSEKFPEYREYILRGRVAVAAAISDNHIVYCLTDDKINDYIEMKQDQVVAAVCEKMQPEAETFIRKITAEFFVRVIKVQKWMCIEKIAAYEEALHRFRMQGSKVRCEAKIRKNEKYIEAINDIANSKVTESGRIDTDSGVDTLTGLGLIRKNIAHIETMRGGKHD